MIIKASVTNLDNEDLFFSLGISGEEDWAKLVSIIPEVFQVGEGQSSQVEVKLMVDKKIEGDKTFNLNIYSEGILVSSQPITVKIQKSSFNLVDFIVDNKKTIAIVLADIILFLLIVIFAMKILRRKN